MRLHHLRVTAFGPFPGTVEVDLDALGAAGLFLINGPTGSGKTSLLDAVCFALYGDIPGARPKGALRSDHAAPDAVPTVELEWSVGGRRFRITRSPEFERPKRRGTGTTRQQHKVVMVELVDGAWVDRGSGRADEVGAVVREVLGLGLEQFSTVVLLPQGDFARFLRASTDDRAAILQRLFDTGRFQQVRAWLEDRRRTAEAEVKDARAVLSTNLTRVLDAAGEALALLPDRAPATAPQDPGVEAEAEAGVAAPVLAADQTDPDALRAGLDAVTLQVQGVVAALTAEAEARESAHAAAAAADETGRRQQSARAKGEQARGALEALEERADDVETARARLEAAVEAAEVLPHVQAQARRETDHAAAQEALHRAFAALTPPLARSLGAGTVDAPEAHPVPTPEALAAVDDDLGRATALVSRLEAQIQRAEAAEREAETLATSVRQAAERVRQTDEALALATRRRVELADELERLAAGSAREPGLRARLDLLRDAQARGLEVEARRRAAAEAATTAEERALLRAEQQQAVADLLARRAGGLAAELAAALVDDEPCPVCGSRTHPDPASTQTAQEVTADDVAEAEEQLARRREEEAQAVAARERARAAQEAQEAELARLLETAGLEDPAVLPAVVEEAEQEHAAARTAQTQHAEATERHRQVEASLEGLRRAQAEATQEQAATRSRVASAEQARVRECEQAWRLLHEVRSVELLDLLADAGGAQADSPAPGTTAPEDAAPMPGPPGAALVAETTSAVTQAAASVQRLRDALAEHTRATTELDTARAALTGALQGSAFADAAAAQAAALGREQRAALEETLAQHAREVERARTTLADPDVVTALAAEPLDLATLAQALVTARDASREATGRARVARAAAQQLARHRAEVLATLDELGPKVHQAEVVREVADTVAGVGTNNVKRMSLPTYVLAARLEEVVELANQRLSRMTDGRYALQHSDALAARGARSGLGLQVVDAWSGKARDTATLSGGETFMASLALALGLGDAVRAESGGTDLDTLFVDEGFGTLDEAALEQVMEVLDGLREGGRSIGIISHVAELRQRIPAQVRLSRSQQGSTLEVVTMPDPV